MIQQKGPMLCDRREPYDIPESDSQYKILHHLFPYVLLMNIKSKRTVYATMKNKNKNTILWNKKNNVEKH